LCSLFRSAAEIEGPKRSLAAILSDDRSHQTDYSALQLGIVDPAAIGVEPHVHDLVTGAILVGIAILDAPELVRRVTAWRLDHAERQALARTSA
jgi:hypothetical protein